MLLLQAAAISSPEDYSQLPACLQEFQSAFDPAKARKLLGHLQYDFEFKLTSDLIKIQSSLYALSPPELKALDIWLDDMLEKDFIFASSSAVASPLLFVKKSDGSLHPCINYQRLNNITVPNHYPLPLDSAISRSVENAKVFSKMDL